MRIRFLLCMGLLALSLTGCAKDNADNMENAENAEVSEATIEDETLQTDGENMQWINTKVQGTDSGVVINKEKGGTLSGKVEQAEADPKMVQASLDALKSYFDITVNMEDYEVSTNHFEGSEDAKADTSYYFSSPKNIGTDGFLLKNPVMPSYDVLFFDNGELKAIYLLNMDLILEKPDKPVTVEDAKKIATEFMVSKQILPEDQIKLLGASVTNDISISVLYEDGKDGAVAVQVDVKTGTVGCFDRLTRERGMKWITPIEAGSGVG